MSTTPPRRSRKKPPSNNSLPFIPIIIGVVVLGFVIGAGLSVMGRHGSGDAVALATSSPFADDGSPKPTPIPATVRTPHAIVTEDDSTPAPERSPKPRASPARSPEPQRSNVAAVANVGRPSPAASQAPASGAPATPIAPVSPAAQTTSGTTSAPYTHRPSTAEPTVLSTAAPTSVQTPAPAPVAAVLDSDSDFSRLAGNVVRQYLLSISRGDTESAYAALGDGPGSNPGSVPEVGPVDLTMHISKIQARGSDSAATVNVDLTTSTGSYYGQYTVHKSATGAAIIVSHTFGKP